jgi:RNA polymerase sigma factor (sigma-70 family)
MNTRQIEPVPDSTESVPAQESGYCFAEAGGGDGRAWELLVRRYQPYLLRLAASYRIGEDAPDAVQNTFLRLLEHGSEIRKPEAVKYWLATVLRRECLAVIARRREQPTEDASLDALLPPSGEAVVDQALLAEEDARCVREALTRLPDRQRELLVLLSDPDTSSYKTVGERMDMPIGSIGPTRQRALTRLQEALSTVKYDVRV